MRVWGHIILKLGGGGGNLVNRELVCVSSVWVLFTAASQNFELENMEHDGAISNL